MPHDATNRVSEKRRWASRHALAFTLSFVAVALAGLEASRAEEVWEFSPYRVHVWLTLGESPQLTPRLEAEIAERLINQAYLVDPSSWRLTVGRPHLKLRGDCLTAIEKMTFRDVEAADLVLVTRRPDPPADSEADGGAAGDKSPDAEATDAAAAAHPIQQLADLAKPNLKIGLCDPESLLGRVTKELLEKHELWDKVQDNLAASPSTGQPLVDQVLDGSLDGAIVYNLYIHDSADKLNVTPLPSDGDSRSLLANDKLMLVAVDVAEGSFRVRARELDCRTQHWGFTVERRTQQLETVPDIAFEALTSAFRTALLIDKVRGKDVELRLRAGGLLFGSTYAGIDRKFEEYGGKVAEIGHLMPGGPAERAGIQVGDIVTKYNGEELSDFASLTSRLRRETPGNRVVWEVARGREKLSVEVIVAGRSPAWVATGSLMQPIIRRNDRYGELRPDGIEVVEWTFLSADQQRGSIYDCTIHSAMRTPISGRSSQKIEKYALAVTPPGDATRLVLRTQGAPDKPLAGYEIHARYADSTDSELLGRTDLFGAITIEQGSQPLRLLFVKSGSQLLARLPMIPGLMAEQSVDLRSDDHRLGVEAVVSGLKNEFMDLVARRHVLAARVRLRIADGEFDKAKELIKQLRELTPKDRFEQRLIQDKLRMSTSDERMQAKIDQLFGEIQTLLPEHLDPQLPGTLETELAAARRGASASAKRD